jgi:hypothetical protein
LLIHVNDTGKMQTRRNAKNLGDVNYRK